MSRDELSAKLELEKIIFIGRTFEEYMDMFALDEGDLKGKNILDCPAGACSFTAVGSEKGASITACDLVYHHPVQDLKQKGLVDMEYAIVYMNKVKDSYMWDYFKDFSELKACRKRALKECILDMESHQERYVPAVLPTLPFKDQEFDLVLSAHFLFMYADRLDEAFHLETLKELLRVSKEEVRIFPVVDLEGKKYEHLEKLKAMLTGSGYRAEEIKVPYEFQKGANAMLKITK